MLTFRHVDAFYGRAQVLFGVSFDLQAAQAAVLLGRNGAGKSTALKTAMGLVPAASGEIVFEGERIERLPAWQIARSGLGYVPEDRRVFADLTVRENLEVGRLPPRPGLEPWEPRRLYELFPLLEPLASRRALHLSGGEQQMLTIARTLMGNPKCLLLDEPSEGLAPLVVQQLAKALRTLKSQGMALLLAEQNMAFAAGLADAAHVIEKGALRYSGPLAALAADERLRAEYLGP